MGITNKELVDLVKELKAKKKTDTGSTPNTVSVNPIKSDKPQRMNEEKAKTAVFAFGRFNPPTIGHEKMIDAVHNEAKKHGAVGHVYASHTEGKSKDPLSQKDKLHYMNKAFGYKVDVHGSSKEMPTFMHVAKHLHQQGHEHLVMVAGEDRVKDYEEKLHKYNGKDYNFKSIKVISAGHRDPDAEGAEGMSASKMRAHAHAGEHEEFKKGLPKALHPHAQEIMDKVRAIKEEIAYRAFEFFYCDDLTEAVVSLPARMKRAQNMRKYKSRLARGKKLAQARMASTGKLRAKTSQLARRVVKKQTAGQRGWSYQKLSASDKISIDKMVDRKLQAVQRVAARLAPKVRQAEVKRMAARAAGRGNRGTLSYVNQK